MIKNVRPRLRMSKKSSNFAPAFYAGVRELGSPGHLEGLEQLVKQTKNINKHANNQTETWIGHSV